MIVTLDAKRRVSVPAALAPSKPGDQFEATFDADQDAVVLRRLPRRKSWLQVMRQCPIPMDDLPPRSREMPRKIKL
jgi:bifunctional DNA-binding transcriptional regulator/antitoxin component of YhaV-PrlF toxin-antitoxin module